MCFRWPCQPGGGFTSAPHPCLLPQHSHQGPGHPTQRAAQPTHQTPSEIVQAGVGPGAGGWQLNPPGRAWSLQEGLWGLPGERGGPACAGGACGCLVVPRRGLVQGEPGLQLPPQGTCGAWGRLKQVASACLPMMHPGQAAHGGRALSSWTSSVGAEPVLLPPAPAHRSVPETKPAVQGEVKQYDSYHKRSKILYDDLLEEWLALPRAKFQCLLPRARCALLCSALQHSALFSGGSACTCNDHHCDWQQALTLSSCLLQALSTHLMRQDLNVHDAIQAMLPHLWEVDEPTER